MSPADRPSTRAQRGDEAVQLAHELSDRITRERKTVRAIKDHLLAVAEPVEPPAPEERLHAPSRQAPAVEAGEAWLPLGEVLCWRQGMPADDGLPEGGLRLELAGEVDMSGALRLRTLVAGLLGDGLPRLGLDLGQVSFMDSNGLSALLWVRRQAMTTDTELVLTKVHPQLLRLFQVTGLDALLLR